MKDAATKSYLKKGQDIVNMNHEAIERGANAYVKIEVPASWNDAVDDSTMHACTGDRPEAREDVNNVVIPVNTIDGKYLPVSTFKKVCRRHLRARRTAAYEKRGVAVDVPTWNPETVSSATSLLMVCPHAVIRPVPDRCRGSLLLRLL